jgi:hypothetical protein
VREGGHFGMILVAASDGRAAVALGGDDDAAYQATLVTVTAAGIDSDAALGSGMPVAVGFSGGQPLVVSRTKDERLVSQQPREGQRPLRAANGSDTWDVTVLDGAQGAQATVVLGGPVPSYLELRSAAPSKVTWKPGGSISGAQIERDPSVAGVGYPAIARLRGVCSNAGLAGCRIDSVDVTARYQGRTTVLGRGGGGVRTGKAGEAWVILDFLKRPSARSISRVLSFDRWLHQRKSLRVTLRYRFTDPTGVKGAGSAQVTLRAPRGRPKCVTGCRTAS